MLKEFKKFTPAQVQEAREAAAKFELNLIAALESGKIECRDPKEWIQELRGQVEDILAGKLDHNFTIAQRMISFLTGECPALLPK